jgi:ferrous-iron efflux pump FieF
MLASILDRRLTAAQAQKFATTAALSVGVFLVAVKTAGYVATDSLSLLSSLVDSASDIVASLGTYIGVRTALQPADAEHRFGHGKAEAMAALGTAAFVLGSASFLVVEAVSRIVESHQVEYGQLGIAIMLLSMLVTSGLVWFQRYVVKRTGSTAIAADEVHYTADFMANGAVIVSLVLTVSTGIYLIDAFVGIAIAVWLVSKVVPVAREAVNMLMDRELEQPERERIRAIAASHQMVKGVHDLRTRKAGSALFVELHIEFDPELSLRKAHASGVQIESAVRQAFPGAEVLIHFDPEGVEEHRLDDRIAQS